MNLKNNIIINSGGQTGVDRAALDFALANGLPCQGWCQQGRLAEDGIISFRYPLSETNSPDPTVRTELNVSNSDATLIVIYDDMDEGTLTTKDFALEYNKPLFVWKIGQNTKVSQFKSWMLRNQVEILNIAGPRASNAPDIYGETLEILEMLLSEFSQLANSDQYVG